MDNNKNSKNDNQISSQVINDSIASNTKKVVDSNEELNQIVLKWLNLQKIIKEEITLHDISNYYIHII